MCGIVGIVSNITVREDALKKAINLLHMRGPGSQKIWLENNIGLAHSRLSVIDLSSIADLHLVTDILLCIMEKYTILMKLKM